MSRSLPPGYFDELYGRDPDPWRFATSAYEAAKYAATLAALADGRRYAAGFEVGCSIGVLTRHLADRIDRLLAVDVADAALDQARARCRDRPNVEFARLALPDEWPEPGRDFDLIVLSEVGYYWTPADLDRALAGLTDRLRPGGALLLVHWRGAVPNYPLTGDQVHRRASAHAAAAGLERGVGRVEERYRLDRFDRPTSA